MYRNTEGRAGASVSLPQTPEHSGERQMSINTATTWLVAALVATATAVQMRPCCAAEEAAQPDHPADEAADTAEEPRDEVYIGGDDQVLTDLERATKLEQEQNWQDAAAIYQSIIDKQLDRQASAAVLVHHDPLTGDLYVSAAEESRRRLARFPAEQVRALAARQEAAAREAFDSAAARRDLPALVDVARRHPLTASALRATDMIGDIWFERGDFAAAADAWQKLLASLGQTEQAEVAALPVPAQVAAKSAFATALLGNGKAARELLAPHAPDTQVSLGGKQLSVRDALQRLDALQPPRPTGLADDWPSIAGNTANNAFAREIVEPGKLVWSADLPTAAVSADILDDYRGSNTPLPRIHYPIVSGGRVFVNTGIEISCLNLASGKRMWSWRPKPVRRAARDLVGGGFVRAGRLFAAISGSLAALDCETGRLLWQTSEHTDAIFREEVLVSQPVVAGGTVFAGVTAVKAEGESFLVALSAGDGRLLAKVFLESHSRPRYIGLGALGSMPAADAGTVIYCTNLGTVAAVDAQSLEVTWLWRYPSSPPDLRDHRIDRDNRWAVNPPVIVGGTTVLVAPQDSAWLYALSRRDGSLLWRQPARGSRYFLAPAVTGKAFMIGRRIAAIDCTTGKVLWTSADTGEEPSGRPVAAAGGILVPGRSAIRRFAADDGRLDASTALQEPAESGTMNICIAGDRLIAGTPAGVKVFAPATEPGNMAGNDWRAIFDEGELLLNRGRPAEAATLLAKALEKLKQRQETDAIDDEAVLQQPNIEAALVKAYEMQANALASKSQPDVEAAIRFYTLACDAAADPGTKSRVLLVMAELLARNGQHGKAIDELQRVIHEFPDALHTLREGVQVHAAMVAQNRIERIIADRGELVYAAQEQAAAAALAEVRALAGLAEPAGLADDYGAVVAEFPNSNAAAEAAVAAARLILKTDGPEKAADYLEHAAGILPERSCPAILYSAAELLKEAGGRERARAFGLDLMMDYPMARVGPDGILAADYCEKELARTRYQLAARKPARRLAMPVGERWRAAARLCSAAPAIAPGEYDQTASSPFGGRGVCFIAHSDTPGWMRLGPMRHRARYDYLECRTAREGWLVWSRSLPPWDGQIHFAASRVVIARPGYVVAFDSTTGATSWRHDAEGGETDFGAIVAAASDAGRVVICTADGKVTCLNERDGTVAWKQQIENAFILRNGIVILEDSVAVFSENPAGMHCFGKGDGTRLPPLKFDVQNARINNKPVVLRRTDLLADLIAVQVSDSTTAMVSVKNGSELWRKTVDYPVAKLLADPSGRYLVVVPDWAQNAKMQVLDAETGTALWERVLLRDTLFDAAVDSRGVFTIETVGGKQRVKAFSLAKGEPLFPDYIVGDSDLTTVGLSGECVVLSGQQARPRVLVLDGNGMEAFAAVPAGVEYLSAEVVDGTLVVATDRGTFGYGKTDTAVAEWRAVRAAEPVKAPDADSLVKMAQYCFEGGKHRAALPLLAEAVQDAPDDADYFRIYDRLSGIRDQVHEEYVPRLRCVKMDRPPTIDGLIADDWDESACLRLEGPEYIETLLPGPVSDGNLIVGMVRRGPARWRGPSDLSMKIYAGWDDENFYLAVDVTDRTHRVMDRDVEKWVGDLLIIGVDCLNDGGFGYGFGDFILTQGLMDKPKDDRDKEDVPEGNFSVKLKPDHSGVVYENSIPWKYFKQIVPAVGTRFGLGVTVTDDDGGGVAKSISWTPGMYLHADPSLLSRSFAPEVMGDVELTLPQGYDAPEQDEEP